MHQTSSNRNWKSPKYPCLALRGRETCSKHFLSCTDYCWIHQKNLIHLPTNWTWPRNHQFGVDCAAERQGSQTTWFIQLTNSKGFFGTNFTYGPFEYVQCSFSSSPWHDIFWVPEIDRPKIFTSKVDKVWCLMASFHLWTGFPHPATRNRWKSKVVKNSEKVVKQTDNEIPTKF